MTDTVPDHDIPSSPERALVNSYTPQHRVRIYTWAGIALLVLVAGISGACWHVYPVFVDTYYHMAAIHGFQQADGIVTHAFWEMAPGGRVHIYPPALHTTGYLFTLIGVTPIVFITVLSWAFYAGCFFTTWLWIRSIAGPRAAVCTIALLCGPATFFWNQSAHTANAAVLLLAPLALLALERERFLLCGVLNFVAMSMHPIGLFLPPALFLTSLLRRKKLLPGLLAASVPALLYSPWLLHVWANRSLLPAERTGGEISMGRQGATIGLIMLGTGALGLLGVLSRRKAMLGVLGAILGFAVVFPFGFGGRFFTFNVHWPLACLGGIGIGLLVEFMERRRPQGLGGPLLALCVAIPALVASPTLGYRPEAQGPPRPPQGEAQGKVPPEGPRPARTQNRPRGTPSRRPRTGWSLRMESSALARLCDGSTGMGPGPNVGRMDLFHQPGAVEFFAAVTANVAPRAILHIGSPPAAALLAGATGRWTTNGILREVPASEPLARPAACDFAAILAGDPQPPGRAGMQPRFRARRREGPAGFELVFENQFGTLWKNPEPPDHDRTPTPPILPRPFILVLLSVGLVLVVWDFTARRHLRLTQFITALAVVITLGVMAPLTLEAINELKNPPEPPPPRVDAPEDPGTVPARIPMMHRRLQEAVQEHLRQQTSPDHFWPPDKEEVFHELMREGSLDAAETLLREALDALERTQEQ